MSTTFVICLMTFAAGTRPGAGEEGINPPPAVGDSEERSNLTVWLVDDQRIAARWNEPGQFRHERLLQTLRAAGRNPRIEHIGESDFPARWKNAEEHGRLPQVLAATRLWGEVRSLDQSGAFRLVASERLAHDKSVCPDLAGRFLFLPRGSPHAGETAEAMRLVLRSATNSTLPGPVLAAPSDRLEAEHTARRAVTAYLEGDPGRLRLVASPRSSQLGECTVPGRWNVGVKAQTGDVDLRGRGDLAVAVVDSFFESERVVGADHVAVVLVREDRRWMVLCVCRDLVTVREAVPALCEALARIQVRSAPGKPAAARLLEPNDSQDWSASRPFLVWAVPADGESLLAQVYEQHTGDMAEKDARWPDTRLRVFAPDPRGGKLNPFEGVVGSRMSWTVWTIGQSGQIAVTPSARFGIGR
jgi:hypothetical protein